MKHYGIHGRRLVGWLIRRVKRIGYYDEYRSGQYETHVIRYIGKTRIHFVDYWDKVYYIGTWRA